VRVVSIESVSGSLLGRARTGAPNRLRLFAIVVCPRAAADTEDRGNRFAVRGSLAAVGRHVPLDRTCRRLRGSLPDEGS